MGDRAAVARGLPHLIRIRRLAALGAAALAYRGIQARIGYDRAAATEADTRERWWQAYTHLWDNREEIPTADLLNGVASLEEVVETRQQSAMLDLLLADIETDVKEESDEEPPA